jgi:hypothetical protein
MATGIQSFNDPGSIGPLYPFPGSEVALAIVGIVLWIVWHVLQNRAESREWRDAAEAFDERLLLPGAGEPERPAFPSTPPSTPGSPDPTR